MKSQKTKPKPGPAKAAARGASSRVQQLEREVRALKRHCKKLRDAQAFTVPVETLAPEPFVLKKALQIVVRPCDGRFTATLFDANIGMTGDTPEEAVESLKSLLVDTLEFYENNESLLGPEPARQLHVLREFIQRQA